MPKRIYPTYIDFSLVFSIFGQNNFKNIYFDKIIDKNFLLIDNSKLLTPVMNPFILNIKEILSHIDCIRGPLIDFN
jgi:hypothetical protein